MPCGEAHQNRRSDWSPSCSSDLTAGTQPAPQSTTMEGGATALTRTLPSPDPVLRGRQGQGDGPTLHATSAHLGAEPHLRTGDGNPQKHLPNRPSVPREEVLALCESKQGDLSRTPAGTRALSGSEEKETAVCPERSDLSRSFC
ncbi:hypothetical protein JRQ81_008163 [Phrynocephalus forsythii]|uniref:Uncharacterized protein n=1 Tax=Phrynocephalus forsythii TaxID=171643 RepID=A0A9Q1ATB5_9SAUR|nr:hypothetical protein JRQ81_008163 [Phrynocephalus forsythii]